jgi:hypothetical protein
MDARNKSGQNGSGEEGEAVDLVCKRASNV